MPEQCSISDVHSASVPFPVGPTMPIPVMATVEWSVVVTGAVWRIRRSGDRPTPRADVQMGDPGFEPGTSSLSERRSNRLS